MTLHRERPHAVLAHVGQIHRLDHRLVGVAAVPIGPVPLSEGGTDPMRTAMHPASTLSSNGGRSAGMTGSCTGPTSLRATSSNPRRPGTWTYLLPLSNSDTSLRAATASELLARAEAADQADVADGMSIPKELARREERLAKLPLLPAHGSRAAQKNTMLSRLGA